MVPPFLFLQLSSHNHHSLLTQRNHTHRTPRYIYTSARNKDEVHDHHDPSSSINGCTHSHHHHRHTSPSSALSWRPVGGASCCHSDNFQHTQHRWRYEQANRCNSNKVHSQPHSSQHEEACWTYTRGISQAHKDTWSIEEEWRNVREKR